MSDIDALIARLEAASEGSRELDLDIGRVIYPEWQWRVEPAIPALLMASRVMVTTESGADEHVNLSCYTSALDAALTLVGDKWWMVGLGKTRDDEPLYGAAIYAPVVGEPQLIASGEHDASAALALCVAALKARKATQ